MRAKTILGLLVIVLMVGCPKRVDVHTPVTDRGTYRYWRAGKGYAIQAVNDRALREALIEIGCAESICIIDKNSEVYTVEVHPQ
jgi:hypothetical protein